MKVPWECMQYYDVNGKADFVTENLTKSIRNFVKIVPLYKSINQWYTRELQLLRIDKDNLYKTAVLTDLNTDWLLFKETSSAYSTLIKDTKNKYYKNRLLYAKNDQKKAWSILKEIINQLSIINEEITSDKNVIHEKFNKFFIESIKDIQETIPEEIDEHPITSSVHVVQFVFQLVSFSNIIAALKNIASKCDCQFLNKNVLLDAFSVINFATS